MAKQNPNAGGGAPTKNGDPTKAGNPEGAPKPEGAQAPDGGTQAPDPVNPDNGGTPSGDGSAAQANSADNGNASNNNNTESKSEYLTKAVAEARGELTLNAVRAKISTEQVENLARGLASDAMETHKTTVDKRGKVRFLLESVGGTFAGFMAGGLIGAGVLGAVMVARKIAERSARKSAALQNYYKIAKEAIEETGNLDAGKAAVERLMESKDRESFALKGKSKESLKETKSKIIEDLKQEKKAGEGTEKFIFERAKEALKDESVQKMYEENGEVFEKSSKGDSKSEKLRNALADYADEYLKVKGDEKAEAEALKAAKEKIEKIDLDGDGGMMIKGNYDDVLQNIKTVAEKVQEKVKADDKFKDVDSFDIRQAIHSNIDISKVNMKAGLNTDELKTMKLSEKATLSARGGIILGAAIGIGSEVALMLGRQKLIKKITDKAGEDASKWLNVVAPGLAATIGGVKAFFKRKDELKRQNIKQALGKDDGSADDHGLFEKMTGLERKIVGETKFKMFNVAEKTAKMNDLKEKLLEAKQKGENTDSLQQEVINLMAEFDATNKIQNQYGNRFKLFQFNGRENIDEAKLNIMKSKSALKKLLKNEFGVTDIDSRLQATTKSLVEGQLGKEVAQVKRNRTKAIWYAGLKRAIIAGGTAQAARGAMGVVKEWKWAQKAGGWILEKGRQAEEWRVNLFSWKWWQNYAAKTSLLYAAVGGGDGGKTKTNNPEDGEETTQQKPGDLERSAEEMEKELNAKKEAFGNEVRSKNAPILVEDEPGTGIDLNGNGKLDIDEYGRVRIGADLNGNGRLDLGEYMGERSFNLNNDGEFEALKAELAKYGFTVEKGQFDTEVMAIKSVKDYVADQANAVDININNMSSKSKTLVVLHRPTPESRIDSMNMYTMKIDGYDKLPAGTKAYIDLDGNGSMKALEFEINKDGTIQLPASVVDAEHAVDASGKANIFGKVVIGRVDENGELISYGSMSSTPIDSNATIVTTERVKGTIATFRDAASGKGYGQAVITGNGLRGPGNWSHLYNGDAGRMPIGFIPETTAEPTYIELADGTQVEQLRYTGGYRPEYDSALNDPYKGDGNGGQGLLGIKYDADLDGDGILSQEEKTKFLREWIISHGTDADVLAQDAARFGMLESDVLKDALFDGDEQKMLDFLKSCGIKGDIDTWEELDNFMDKLKLPSNAALYDKLVNSTIGEIEKQIAGCDISLEMINERTATSLKGFGLLTPDTVSDTFFGGDENAMIETLRGLGIEDGHMDTMEELNLFIDKLRLPENKELYEKLLELEAYGDLGYGKYSGPRQIIYFFHEDANGNRIYDIGNKSFVARDLGAENGKIGVMPRCRQIATPRGGGGTPKTPDTPPKIPEKPPIIPDDPTPPEDPPVIPPEDPPVTPPEEPPVTPPEEPPVKPKDPELMKKMDDTINAGIAEEAGVDKVTVEKIAPNEGNTVESLPSDDAGAGDFVTNEAATRTVERNGQVVPAAKDVTVSAENDYSQNLNEPTGVYKPDIEAQEEANRIAAEKAAAVNAQYQQEMAEKAARDEAARQAERAAEAARQAEAEAAERAREADILRQQADLEAAREAQRRAAEAAEEAARAQAEEAAAQAAAREAQAQVINSARDEDDRLAQAFERMGNED